MPNHELPGKSQPLPEQTPKKQPVRLRALKAAFPYTIPIFAGFWFLGLAYGILMNKSGFSFLYPLAMSSLIFGGSLEFVAISMLLAPFAPLQTFLMAFMVQARHLFYGITMLDKYKGTGWKKFFLIYMMCDETFSINCSAVIPEDVDRGWFYLWTSVLDYTYWVSGAVIGGLAGSLLAFNTHGLNFVMTAMFTVIFLDQWMKEKHHYSAYIGLGSAILARLLFTSSTFMIPTMVLILILLTIFRGPIEKKGGFAK